MTSDAVTATLLVELVTEELPPKALRQLSEAFAEALAAGLRGFLSPDSVTTPFATPRRFAASITQVANRITEPARAVPLLPINVAFDDAGKPTPALEKSINSKAGFETFSRVPSDRLERRSDGKVERLYYIEPPDRVELRSALAEALDGAIARLPIPKVMSYSTGGGYYNNEKFVRPAHRLVALHGSEVVPVESLGLRAGNLTSGHRFLARNDLAIASADGYAPTLEAEGKVVPSFADRRKRIVDQLDAAAAGATVIMPDALLDEVTALVEWPKVYTGGFAASFLEVPHECLILTMQHNQRYFALADAGGALQNRFLMVSNVELREPEEIIRGNERVLRARLADAKFFFDQDRKQSLASRVARLDGIVYHNKLGSQGQRIVRLRLLARQIAKAMGCDEELAERAALLAKADLVTEMVGEFPELQGTMGRYYARHDREASEVADAIAQHYWPRFAGDALPEGPAAQAVALADKLEALAGLFGVGQAPSGDKDPFGLRRAAIGVVRILVEKKLALPLPKLVDMAFGTFSGSAVVRGTHAEVATFIYERLRSYLREQGYSANQVAAVVDSQPPDIHLVPERLEAVRVFERLPEAEALAVANKRIANILRKSESEAAPAVDRSLLGNGAEHDLYAKVQALLPVVHQHVDRGEYTEALCALASAKASVDRFFDDVLVMAEDPALRANRLALLRGLAETMNQVADISKLATR